MEYGSQAGIEAFRLLGLQLGVFETLIEGLLYYFFVFLQRENVSRRIEVPDANGGFIDVLCT